MQRQETGILTLYAQISIWVSVSGEKAPVAPYFGPISQSVKYKCLGPFSPSTLTQIKV